MPQTESLTAVTPASSIQNGDNLQPPQRVQTLVNRSRFNFFSIKKCWICLAELDLDETEQLTIQKYFIEKNLYFLTSSYSSSSNCASSSSRTNYASKLQSNFIQLKLFMDKFVLSVCKCRKKLAHITCFNNYIDMKQNGNINVDIVCSKCNFKYEFEYPYNSKIFVYLFVCFSFSRGHNFVLDTL